MFTLTTHERDNKGHIIKVNPYIRFCTKGHPPLFIQKGHVYSEGGQGIHNPPDWFWDCIEQADPKSLAKVGWDRKRPVKLGRPFKKKGEDDGDSERDGELDSTGGTQTNVDSPGVRRRRKRANSA